MQLLGATDDIISYNLFAYCGNNPITGYDPEGTVDIGNIFKGGWWMAVGVTAMVVGVSVLTCGVAAPAMLAIAGVTIAAGAATTVNGVSELGEAATGHNFVLENAFKNDKKAYDIYAHSTAALAEIGTLICGGWLGANAPRISAYNNIENYQFTKTISDAKHAARAYNDSVLLKKMVIKYGEMTKDSFGYVFSAMGQMNNGNEKLWRLGVNITEQLVWHWGHGF